MLVLAGCENHAGVSLSLHESSPPTVILQPFKDLPEGYTASVMKRIKAYCPDVVLKQTVDLPSHSFYKPRQRYRADSIIHWLKKQASGREVWLALTTKDISTTKNGHKDWGVMGLAFRPGKAAIASSYRVGKYQIDEQLFKVAIHELGHTTGLPHCPVKTCYMRDAEGGNPLREETGFCNKCSAHLKRKGWKI